MEGLGEAARLVRGARRGGGVFGGGGLAESGIRTFRGENGIGKQYDPVKTATLCYLLKDPAVYWMVSRERSHTYREAQPNPGHYALAALEELGHLAGVVTQNTDSMHLKAGSQRLVELHCKGRTVCC